MPVLQDPDRRYTSDRLPGQRPPQRSIDDADSAQKLPSNKPSALVENYTSPMAVLVEQNSGTKVTSSREELIECLKRGEQRTWVPGRNVEGAHLDHPRNDGAAGLQNIDLPVQTDVPSHGHASDLALPSEIERPRSALHSGDFREASPNRSFDYQKGQSDVKPPEQLLQSKLGSSPTTPWYVPSGSSLFRGIESDTPHETRYPSGGTGRSRAPSLGSLYSSSFVYRPPTSPLVHSASSTEVDLSQTLDKSARRRTLPPDSFHSSAILPQSSLRASPYSRALPNLRRENTLPYQAHQPQRSLTSNSFLGGSVPFTPTSRSRGQSLSSDVSPLQHASMVGSYEESILRGRMSTTPSKPLDFIAQIGVLGKGDCKPSLRCPPHVAVPFLAVFYSYGSGHGRSSLFDDSPSPYVGNVDLEHHLYPVQSKPRKKQDQRHQSPLHADPSLRDLTAPENTPIGLQLDRRRREKQRRRSRSPITPTGGCYRIPQQGQLQIIIKNQNKTAVKLFLVPYDLDGMEPGTKTFIQQRSYSQGPIVETPITSTRSRSAAVLEKPTLRYLIHLRICCPSRGRFHLYDNIRLVFANRVPDGKEKLRNEIQLPEPRYTALRRNKDISSASSTGAKLAADKAFRRRSSGFGIPPPFGFGDIDGIANLDPAASSFRPTLPVSSVPTYSPIYQSYDQPRDGRASHKDVAGRSDSITSSTNSRPPVEEQPYGFAPQIIAGFNVGSPGASSQNGLGAGSESGDSGSTNGPYAKLRRQDGRYGSSERFQGLLAQRLKGLDVKQSDESGTGTGNDADGDVKMHG